jgi:hypothetical protein
MNSTIEFLVEKNVFFYPNASYEDYWRQARVKNGCDVDEIRYNKYLCAWISIVWPKGSPESLLSIFRFIEKVKRLQEGGAAGFVEYGDGVNVFFNSRRAQFSCAIDSWEETSEGYFSLAEVIFLVEAWREFLQMPDSEQSKMEVALPCIDKLP